MFQGEYREKQRHPADLPAVLQRARGAGVTKIMVTAGSLEESRDAVAMCQKREDSWPELFCTVGVHPTRCGEFEATSSTAAASHLAELLAAGRDGCQRGLC